MSAVISCPSLIVLAMVRTAEEVFFCVDRHKTQVRGRSNCAIAARPMVCSGHEDKSKGDREKLDSA